MSKSCVCFACNLSLCVYPLTKPTSRRSCRTFISIYPVQPEDWIHSIIATLRSKMPTKSTHCRLLANRTMPPFSSHRNTNKGSFKNRRWRALSLVNTLTEQATETVTIRTFSNQKPWVDRTIRDAVNHRTAAYNAGILSGNMSEYKIFCYTLRRAVRATKRRYRERIESHFQLNDSRRMWEGLKTICSSGNNSSAEVRADPLLAEELNTFYGRFECNGGGATLPISVVRKQQTEQRSCIHPVRGRGSERNKESEHQESSRTWWDYWPRSEVLCWSACWFCLHPY